MAPLCRAGRKNHGTGPHFAHFRALARTSSVGRVLSGEAHGTRITALPKPSTSSDGLRWKFDGAPWKGSVAVELGGMLSLYRFDLEFRGQIDGRLTTPTPAAIERIRTRRHVRLLAPPHVKLRYLARDDRRVERAIVDVSRQGLAFTVSARDALPPGSEIAEAVIDWQSRLRICGRLVVRHISEQFGEGAKVAGCTFIPQTQDDEFHLRAELEQLMESGTRIGRGWTRDLWELFEKSGYFTLSNKRPADFVSLRQAFETTGRKLAESPGFGVQIVRPSGRGLEASASVIALNSHAVFLYHVARRHGTPPPGVNGRDILFDLYERVARWVSENEYARWLIVWVQDAARFPKSLHLDFAARHDDGHRASVVKFRALEVPVNRDDESQVRTLSTIPRIHGGRGDWSIRHPTNEELNQIGSAAAARFPPCFVAAHALFAPFEPTWKRWNDAGLMRGRDIIVAARGGRIEAAAIVECAEAGLHLFGLLDVVRIIPLGSSAEEASSALLNRARHLFSQLKKSFFIYACEPDVPRERWPLGCVDLGLTHCTVISSELLPQFAQHIWELTWGTSD